MTGNYEAKPLQGVASRKRVLKDYQKQIKEFVIKIPDATLEEFAEQLPIRVSTSAEQDRPGIAQKRAEWNYRPARWEAVLEAFKEPDSRLTH